MTATIAMAKSAMGRWVRRMRTPWRSAFGVRRSAFSFLVLGSWFLVLGSWFWFWFWFSGPQVLRTENLRTRTLNAERRTPNPRRVLPRHHITVPCGTDAAHQSAG